MEALSWVRLPGTSPEVRICSAGSLWRKSSQENPCRQCGEPDREQEGPVPAVSMGTASVQPLVGPWVPCVPQGCPNLRPGLWLSDTHCQPSLAVGHSKGHKFQELPALWINSGSRSQGQLAREDHTQVLAIESQHITACGQTVMVKGIPRDLDGLQGSAAELKSRTRLCWQAR